MKKGLFKVGTLNCRSMRTAVKKMNIADDMAAYGLSVLGVQETHMTDKDVETIRTSDGKKAYTVHHSGQPSEKRAGCAIIIAEGLKCTFTAVSGRLCMMKLSLKDRNINRPIYVINCYAPTEPNCDKDSQLRETFYSDLTSLANTVCRRAILMVIGDFNAKTGSGYAEYRQEMGPHGKGDLSNNGRALLEFANQQHLVLTNTLFQHKLAHVTTWESPYREVKGADGTVRRNPYRNQIDYILIRRHSKELVKNSRSHNGLSTFTDHRLVRMTMFLHNHGTKRRKTERIDFQKLKDPVTRAKYSFAVEMKMMDREDNRQSETICQQQRWNDIVEANREAAEEVLGFIDKKNRSQDPTITRLSAEQKELGKRQNTESDPTKRDQLRKERNSKLTELHRMVKEKEHEKIISQVREIENAKDDSYRMFSAVRALQTTNVKKTLIIETEDGMTTDTKEQIRAVSQFFNELFFKNNTPSLPNIPPTRMSVPFTATDIEKAVKKLKDNKSAGIDQLRPEQLKKGPSNVYDEIAKIFNIMAETGEHPKEIKTGVLVPLQKPGKAKGPVENLRPIILLSVLRKILAICMLERINEKIDGSIPNSQAAYRGGRSTTEQVFTIKLMAEKAITSSNYSAMLLMMDMSKAFDSIHRAIILEDLQTILLPEELHMIKLMIDDVRLAVKIGSDIGEPFSTNIGTPQGDCISPILFTLYLANALKGKTPDKPTVMQEHSYSTNEMEKPITIPAHLKDHNYSIPRNIGTLIDLQYADDICWVGGNCDDGVEFYKENIPERLKERNLVINPSKTEEYRINLANNDWKKCRYLGSLLDSEEDIKRRKRLARAAYDKIRPALEDKKLENKIKISIFNTMISSVFLYNSEIWTTTKDIQEKIDTYQRNNLRKILNIKYPRKITNEKLYNITKQRPWSETVKGRRLSFFGHMARLPDNAPAKLALDEFRNTKTKKRRGGQKLTWLKQVEREVKPLGIDIEQALEQSQNRKYWRGQIERITRAKIYVRC